ncbi:hypothetical protein BDV26DRAFT_290180 [Aspergillus bertholletiae]|uniref:Uncharacterized protein n=1 Tax=Aspergillus bertholletiae TaxID=1226010 RepID=A0A5N7BG73_9EURO|nr:hypothetical protein BDV26DRAFT_290180 [Aspergillus bertholletiae]
METELGEQLLGDARCTYCKERDVECWAYSSQGQRQSGQSDEILKQTPEQVFAPGSFNLAHSKASRGGFPNADWCPGRASMQEKLT